MTSLAEPSPVKRDYRHVGINGRPDDDKTTYQDLRATRFSFFMPIFPVTRSMAGPIEFIPKSWLSYLPVDGEPLNQI
jgi:hypothetical protein